MPPEEQADRGTTPARAVKALSCPGCGGTVTLRAAGYTVTVACQYCGSLLDVANPDVRLISQYHEAVAELEIPLGTRGTLRGVEWEAIGFLEKSEGGNYPWHEYLLFNPYHGYRWLVTNGRGWSLGEMLVRTPGGGRGTVWLDDQAYAPFFADARSQVDYVLGEFYWRVQVGEEVATDDYVRPGWMLSREANDKEVSWTLSELLAPKEIKQAFGVEPPRNPWPPLPHQPSPYGPWLRRAAKVAGAAALFLLLLAFVFSGGNVLLSQKLPLPGDEQARTATLGPLTLNRPYQVVSITARVPGLENGWVDLEYALVDRKTQESFEAYGAAERYSGRDSDGDWTEGSRSKEVKIATVPAGSYDLVVDYSGHKWSQYGSLTPIAGINPITGAPWAGGQSGRELLIEVRQGSIFWINVGIALLLLFIPFLFVIRRHVKFEQARQDESDFGRSGVAAAFTSDDDDEEDD